MELGLVFGAALAFYSVTLAPTVVWGDSAWLTLYALLGNIKFRTAGDHPLYLKLGELFVRLPGDPARNMAFESAIFGALAVMLVYRICRQLGVSRPAAWLGAGSLCVSHAFWLHAVIPEVYTANAFFLLATVTLLVEWQQSERWPFLAAAVAVWVVGLTNHLALVALLPAIVAFIVVVRPRRFMTLQFAGAVVIAGIGAIAAVLIPSPLSARLHQVWVGPPGISDYFQFDLPLLPMLRETFYYLAYLAYQFPSVSLPLGFVGAWAMLRRQRAVGVLLLAAIVFNAGVFIHHAEWESSSSAKFVFYISDYALFSVLCAFGADDVLSGLRRARESRDALAWAVALLIMAVAIPPIFYSAAPHVSSSYDLQLVNAKVLPYRDNQTYFLNPNKHGYDGARRFGIETLERVPAGAVIYADYTPFAVLRYLQLVERERPDVLLRFPGVGERVPVSWVYDGGRRRPTYLASMSLDYYDLAGLSGAYDLVPAGLVVEVRPRE